MFFLQCTLHQTEAKPVNALMVARTNRGGGVPSFDEMMDFALVEVDFDDPTTNVRGRRALAIAKPTPRGY